MRLLYLVAAALVVATTLTVRWNRIAQPSFEVAIERATLEEQIDRKDSKCPLNVAAAGRSQPWVLAACASGGLGWYEAADAYGDDAAKVFLVFGQDPSLKEIFQQLGPPVIPVIAYFVKNGSTQYLVQEAIGQGIAQLWNGGSVSPPIELSPEQYGLIAIEELRSRGHEMLSEFEIVDGVAVRKQFTRSLFAAKNIVFGGISDLEAVIARGERLPTWSEVGWAALDTTIVVGGFGAAAKTLTVAKAPTALAGRNMARFATLKTAGRGAVRSLMTVGKVAGAASVIALPYIALTRPYLLTGAAAWVAEQTGLPGWVGAFLAYLAFFLVFALIFRIIVRPFVWGTRNLARLINWVAVRKPPSAPALQAYTSRTMI